MHAPAVPPQSASVLHASTSRSSELLRHALERAKDRRFQSATDFANELAKAVPLASDAELVAFLTELAGADIDKQRRAREDAQRNAERWSSRNVALAPARTEPATEAEASVPKSYAGSVRPAASRPWMRWALVGGTGAILIVVGTFIGRMSSSPPAATSEPAPIATPVPVDPTPPPSATVVGASPDPIEVSTAALPSPPSPQASPIKRPIAKPHKPAPSASGHPPAKPPGKYVPGEL